MSEHLTISEIEKLTGVSNSSIRRYLSDFENFFIVKGGSRVKKYEVAAVEIIQRIKGLYDDGMDTQEIYDVLVTEFPLVINGDEPEEKVQKPTVPTLATREEVTKISEDIAAIKKALDEQKQFNQTLLQTNQALLQKMDQDRLFFAQKFEELKQDREFIFSLRESMQQRKLETAAANEEVAATGEEVINTKEEAAAKSSEEVTTAQERKSFWAKLFGKK